MLKQKEQNNRVVTDQMGRTVALPYSIHRIVSLVPSQTELLFSLGLGDRVVGVTKFCIHPKEFTADIPRVGGTKDIKHDLIKQLAPDLIIGNKEENSQGDIEELMRHYPVWMSDIENLTDAIEMIAAIGGITDTKAQAHQIIENIDEGFSILKPLPKPQPVLYLIWRGPYMAAGHGTFINHLLERAGFQNVLQVDRYPELTHTQLDMLKPKYVFLSSEPYPFKEKHIKEIQAIYPKAKVVLVDGEMFSWYGSRLIHSGAYLASLLDSL